MHTVEPVILVVHGGCAAVNRGADCVKYLVPSLRARTNKDRVSVANHDLSCGWTSPASGG